MESPAGEDLKWGWLGEKMGNVETTSGRCCPLFWLALNDKWGWWWGLGEDADDPPDGAKIEPGGDGNSIDFVLRSISNAAKDAASSEWCAEDATLGEHGLSYAPGSIGLRDKDPKPLPPFGDLEASWNISMSSLSSWLLLSSLRWDWEIECCNGALQLKFKGPDVETGSILFEDEFCVVAEDVFSVLGICAEDFWAPNWICCWELLRPRYNSSNAATCSHGRPRYWRNQKIFMILIRLVGKIRII